MEKYMAYIAEHCNGDDEQDDHDIQFYILSKKSIDLKNKEKQAVPVKIRMSAIILKDLYILMPFLN